MGITLPGARNVFLPSLPPSLRELSQVASYLKDLKSAIEKEFSESFDNVYSILATGTTGSFLASGGATISVTNGIIVALA